MSRIIDILEAIKNSTQYTPEAQSRVEAILKAIANNTAYSEEGQSRHEKLLLAIKSGSSATGTAQTRIEEILFAVANGEELPTEYYSELEKAYIEAFGGVIPSATYILKGYSEVVNGSIKNAGQLGIDGKYHIYASNGADIALDNPLRAGDTFRTSGTRTNASGQVNLWELEDFDVGNGFFYTQELREIVKGANWNEKADGISNVYEMEITDNITAGLSDNVIGIVDGIAMYLRDTDFSDVPSLLAYLQEANGQLVYKLSSSTTESITPISLPNGLTFTDGYKNIEVIEDE